MAEAANPSPVGMEASTSASGTYAFVQPGQKAPGRGDIRRIGALADVLRYNKTPYLSFYGLYCPICLLVRTLRALKSARLVIFFCYRSSSKIGLVTGNLVSVQRRHLAPLFRGY